jgi:hypothetical protein
MAAVNLSTAFGVSGIPTAVQTNNCYFLSTHGTSQSINSATITADGIDSAVIQLICNGVPMTTTIPSFSVNGNQVTNVAFPQTVTASAPCSWTIHLVNLTCVITAL